MCMKICTISLVLCITTLTWSGVESKTFYSGPDVERPLRVGAFNIQNLGNSKLYNTEIMNTVHNVLLRYDLVLIQEIVTQDKEMFPNMVDNLNKLHKENNSKYRYVISDRLGRGTAKEQYAYVYRDDKFECVKNLTYANNDDDFMRPPYIAQFLTKTTRYLEKMLVIGIHTQPKSAANETSALSKVYDDAVKKFKIKDAIIMGDMNAGCANVRISDWSSIDSWNRNDFKWLIPHDMDTTQAISCCPYDRIIIAGERMQQAVIENSVGVFKFRDEYGLTFEEGLAVSDHWPIEVKLKGRTSEQAKVHLTTRLCLTIEDARKRALPAPFKTQRTVFGFAIESNSASYEIHATNENRTKLFENYQKLQAKYPELISNEVHETLLYKVYNDALQDPTSNDDLKTDSFSLFIDFDTESKTVSIHFCSATTLN